MMGSNKHEIYKRRGSKNLVVAAVMAAFILLIFLVTIVKISDGGTMQAFDHSVRPELIGAVENSE